MANNTLLAIPCFSDLARGVVQFLFYLVSLLPSSKKENALYYKYHIQLSVIAPYLADAIVIVSDLEI